MPTPLQIWGSSCVFYAEFGDASSVSVVDGLAAAFTDKATGTTYTQPTVGSRLAYQPTGYGGGGAVLMASGKTFTFPQPANFPSGNAPHTIIIVGRYTASNAYPTPFAYGGRSPRAFRSMSARNRRVNAGFFGDDHESTGLGWANVERMVVSMVDGASPVNSWLFNAPNASETKTLAGPLVTPTSSTVEINRTADSFDGPVRAIIVLNRMATLDELSSGYSYFSQPYRAGGGAVPDNAAGAQAATSPSLTPRASLAPASAVQAESASSPTIAARVVTQPDAASQVATATSPTLAPRNASVPDAAAQASTADSPAITPRSAISPDSAVGQQATTSPALSVSGSVPVAPVSQPQATTSPTLAARSALTTDSAAQQSQASSPALSAVRSSVAPVAAAQPMSASQPTIAVAGSVAVVGAVQSQLATASVLSARSNVMPSSAGQTSTVSVPAISTRGSVAANDAQQANSLTGVAIMARFSVNPGSVAQPQVATAPVLSSRASLLVSSAIQTQALTSPALFVGARPLPPSTRTVRSPCIPRIARSPRPSRLAA